MRNCVKLIYAILFITAIMVFTCMLHGAQGYCLEKANFNVVSSTALSQTAYQIQTSSNNRCYIQCDTAEQVAGELVEFIVIVNEGYSIKVNVDASNNSVIRLNNLGQNKYSFTMPSSNVTISAEATILSYDLIINYVYFDGQTAKDTYSAVLDYGADYSVTSPIISGYQADIEVVEGNLYQNQTITVTYHYSENTSYYVYHYLQNTNGAYNNAKVEYCTGRTNSKVYAQYLLEYLDNGYYRASHEDEVLSGYIAADGTLVLKIYYNLHKYHVSFCNEDGTQILYSCEVFFGQSVRYEGVTPMKESTDFEEYTFHNWYTTALTGGEEANLNAITENTQVFARFKTKARSYNIEYHLNGGNFKEGFSGAPNYYYGEGLLLSNSLNLEKKGYTFDGWYLNYTPATEDKEEIFENKIIQISTTDYGNYILYARWILNYNTLTVNYENIILENASQYPKTITVQDYAVVTFKKVAGYDLPTNYVLTIGGVDKTSSTYYQCTDDDITISIPVGVMSADAVLSIFANVGKNYWYDLGIRAQEFSVSPDHQNKILYVSDESEFGLLAYILKLANEGDFSCFQNFGISEEYTVKICNNLNLEEYYWNCDNFIFSAFDGLGYEISNLEIQSAYNEFVGLFAKISSNCKEVKNVKLSGIVNVESDLGYIEVGTLFGECTSSTSFLNVFVDCTISCSGEMQSIYIGGIGARVTEGQSRGYFYNNASVVNISANVNCIESLYIAGLVSNIDCMDIENCYSVCNITANNSGSAEINKAVLFCEVNNVNSRFLYVLENVDFDACIQGEIDVMPISEQNFYSSLENTESLISKLNSWVANKNVPQYYLWDNQNDAPSHSVAYRTQYNVTKNLTYLQCSGGDIIFADQDYIITLIASEGFSVPIKEDIIITMNAQNFDNFLYQDGVLSIEKTYIKGPITIIANGVPKNNTQYIVQHFFENLNGEFEIDKGKTTLNYGTTLSSVNAIALTGNNLPTGFEFNSNHPSMIESGIIQPDGSLVLKLYYNRTLHAVTIEQNNINYGNLSMTLVNNIKYGTSVVIEGNIIKIGSNEIVAQPNDSTEEYVYSFISYQAPSEIVEDAIVIANFARTVAQYEIVFYNWNGVEVLDRQMISYGESASYQGEIPQRVSTQQYNYSFNKWVTEPNGDIEDDLECVTSNRKVYASFTENLNLYTITWKCGDITLEVDYSVAYGQLPVYNAQVPTKAEDEQYIYVFNNWSPSIETVKCNQVYQAVFVNKLKTINVSGDLVGNQDEYGNEIIAGSIIISGGVDEQAILSIVKTDINSLSTNNVKVLQSYRAVIKLNDMEQNTSYGEYKIILDKSVLDNFDGKAKVMYLRDGEITFADIVIDDNHVMFTLNCLGEFAIVTESNNLLMYLLITLIIVLVILTFIILYVLVIKKQKFVICNQDKSKFIIYVRKNKKVLLPIELQDEEIYYDQDRVNIFDINTPIKKALVCYSNYIGLKCENDENNDDLLSNEDEEYLNKVKALDKNKKLIWNQLIDYLSSFTKLKSVIKGQTEVFYYEERALFSLNIKDNNIYLTCQKSTLDNEGNDLFEVNQFIIEDMDQLQNIESKIQDIANEYHLTRVILY